MPVKPADMGRIYYDACDAKGYKGNEGQLKLWRQMLGYAELRDLQKAMEIYWQDNSDFPMPAQLRHLVERARRERMEKSGGPSEMVEYECPSCHAPLSTVVEVGDTRPRLCLVANEKQELRGCRVRLTELSRMPTAKNQKRA
jgi:hypothetical protein